MSDDTFGGRAVPYNIPNRNKYKYLVYMDKLSKVRWGIVYEDMGNMRIVRILEQEKFFASRFPLTESVQYHLSESDLRNIVNNVIREVMAQRVYDN